MELSSLAVSTIGILGAASLCCLLAAACWTDVRERRISNKLVLIGALMGLAINTVLPEGTGLLGANSGGLGFERALGGFVIGLGALLPLYMIRAMGAGDVKLMAMIGAFLGPMSVIGAVLMTLLAGGVLAVAVAMWKGVLRKTLANVHVILLGSAFKAKLGQGLQLDVRLAPVSDKLPYAFAIAMGTFIQLLLMYNGHVIFP